MRMTVANLSWLEPLRELARGDAPTIDWRALLRATLAPVAGVLLFLVVWAQAAPTVNTSLGQLPGPAQVWEQAGNLWAEHRAEQARAAVFYQRLEELRRH